MIFLLLSNELNDNLVFEYIYKIKTKGTIKLLIYFKNNIFKTKCHGALLSFHCVFYFHYYYY
jgi:hypothetical protein